MQLKVAVSVAFQKINMSNTGDKTLTEYSEEEKQLYKQ